MNTNDMRGFAWAIVKNNQVVLAGSLPTADHISFIAIAKREYYEDMAEKIGGDLYVGGYPDREWTPPTELIFDLTWEQIKQMQQGGYWLNLPLDERMPKGAVKIYPQ